MPTKIQKWGNSLGVRLPKKIAERLQLAEGSEVIVDDAEQTIVIRKAVPLGGTTKKQQWKEFVVPTRKKKEDVSGAIDTILYEKSDR